jgi:hypothetical protein
MSIWHSKELIFPCNNDCDSSDEDFRDFYDKQKLQTTLPFFFRSKYLLIWASNVNKIFFTWIFLLKSWFVLWSRKYGRWQAVDKWMDPKQKKNMTYWIYHVYYAHPGRWVMSLYIGSIMKWRSQLSDAASCCKLLVNGQKLKVDNWLCKNVLSNLNENNYIYVNITNNVMFSVCTVQEQKRVFYCICHKTSSKKRELKLLKL